MDSIQRSFDPKEWREDPMMERTRWALTYSSPSQLKRRMFPFSVRVREDSKIYPGLKAGMVIQYARTKLSPGHYPIEAVVWKGTGGARDIYNFSPTEAELMQAVDPKA